MKIQPLFDRVVLKKIKPQKEKIGNLILPTNSSTPELCEVVALGKNGNKNDIDFVVKVGDKVLYNQFSGNEYTIDDEKIILIKQEDIIAIIE